MSQKIHTVNVIEKTEDDIIIHSFNDNQEGNKEAEELFYNIAVEKGYKGNAINADEFCDDEGDYWELESFSIRIIHS